MTPHKTGAETKCVKKKNNDIKLLMSQTAETISGNITNDVSTDDEQKNSAYRLQPLLPHSRICASFPLSIS